METKKRGEVLPNATHLNCWRKKKQRGRVLPNMTHLNDWRQNRGGRWSQQDQPELTEKEKQRGKLLPNMTQQKGTDLVFCKGMLIWG